MAAGIDRSSRSTRRRRLSAAAAALLIIGAMVVLWRGRRVAAPVATTALAPSAAPAAPSLASDAPPPRTATAAELTRPPSAPVIDAIIVDRPALCLGEETLVTVRAHTIDGGDDELHYTIGPHTGQTVALRAWVDERGAPLPYEVTVFGRGNVSVSARVPPFTIRHCAVDEHVVVTHRLLPNTVGVFEFRANVVRSAAAKREGFEPFVPASYAWTTSDGVRASGLSAHFIVDLEDRKQTALYTQASVSVEVAGRDGRRLRGYDALQIMNPAYQAMRRKGVVAIMVRLNPRFPEMSAGGVVNQGVELWHQHESPVTIETVQTARHYVQGRGEAPPASTDVAAVLGKRTIMPGERLRLQVRLDTAREPDVFAVNYALQGVSSEGFPVRGSFAVMRPPAPPTRDNSTPVVEPSMVAKIRAAQALLGRPTVSDEDIWRLEREGKLVAAPAAPAVPSHAASRPADAPRAAPRQSEAPSGEPHGSTTLPAGEPPPQADPGLPPSGPRARD